ncbi:MAG: class I tRNA ligase family protein, partial [Planctomycetota bacterium]
SKTPIEPYLADQWFVAMDELAQVAMDKVNDESVRIFPARYRKGYLDWLGEKRDWPVSRQLWWGHRIPIWSVGGLTSDRCEQLTSEIESIAKQHPDQLVYRTDRDGDDSFALFVCIRDEDSPATASVESLGLSQDPDVLDTWFSSALWPHSTLGWPEQTAELEKFYPTQTLITSRDIITLWVARMVLMGMNNLNQVPFDQVFIHPKILDGLGETMSKSKGNGVDPIDVIDKFGPDALRFGLARLATETQDVRMPVQYECPSCEKLIDQTKKNRSLPRIDCPACSTPFSTQWAETDADKAFPRAAVVSERFETARNFVNKLWNASRFALMNLESFQPISVDVATLPIEDRWLLSRLSSVTQTVSDAIDRYQFAEAASVLYEFAWNEFCSFYVEIAKPRLSDEAADSDRAVAQNLMAHGLDQLLRLLHPIMPFVTESVWSYLGEIAPVRGIANATKATPFLMTASWPKADLTHQDQEIERQFSEFQGIVAAIRQIRASQNIGPRETVPVAVRCDAEASVRLKSMTSYFKALAGADVVDWGASVTAFETDAHVAIAEAGIDVHVDLEQFIDVQAELSRLEKLLQQVTGQISGKEKKLSNQNFVSRAPADVVSKERETLDGLRTQHDSLLADIAKMREKSAS